MPPPRLTSLERIAHNQAWRRTLNQLQAGWMEASHPVADFRCECGRFDCRGERILLSGRDWQEVRSRSTRFAVAPGHVAPCIDSVVEERQHFWLVENLGGAGRLDEKLA